MLSARLSHSSTVDGFSKASVAMHGSVERYAGRFQRTLRSNYFEDTPRCCSFYLNAMMTRSSDESTYQKNRLGGGHRPCERLLRIVDAGHEQQSRPTASAAATTTHQRWGKYFPNTYLGVTSIVYIVFEKIKQESIDSFTSIFIYKKSSTVHV